MSEHWHGTPGGYTNHGCRCESCTTAHREYQRQMKANRYAATKDASDRRHGTANFYGNFGCRCEKCTSAWARAMQKSNAATRRNRQLARAA